MDEINQLLEFLKGIFTGLYNAFFATNDHKVLLVVAIPILFVSAITIFCEFILPAIFALRETKIDTKVDLKYDLQKARLFGVRVKVMENWYLRSYLKMFNVKGLRKFRILLFNNRMNRIAVQKQIEANLRARFQDIYGFSPNMQQLQEFMQFNTIELNKIYEKHRKKVNNDNKEDIKEDKNDDDDNKGNIVALHTDSA